MPYAQWTYNAKNPVRRYSHRRRFELSRRTVSRYLTPTARLLDFGCADGRLLSMLRDDANDSVILHGYEPFPDSKADAGLKIYNSYDDIIADGLRYDIVTCFEVLEHFSVEQQRRLLGQIRRLLVPGGLLIISVPIEYGPTGVFKGLIRRLTDRKTRHIYTASNLFRTLLGRPIPGAREGDGYLSHAGFYFKDLQPLLDLDFTRESLRYSPFRCGRSLLNSQIIALYRINPQA